MKGMLTYSDLESVFDWRLFAAVCGIRVGDSLTPEASVALDSFRSEALSYLGTESLRPSVAAAPGAAAASLRPSATDASRPRLEVESASPLRPDAPCRPAAEWCVRFYNCRRDGEAIVSEDGDLSLPMLRQGSGRRCSLCDLFPRNPAAAAVKLGIFAIKVDAPDSDSNPLIAHAARVCLAEAASEYLRSRFQTESGIRTFMPAVGYPCCPDHSLKRDILRLLDIDIRLTESCAMIPEASICGLIVSSEEFSLFEIRDVLPDELEEYVRARAFTDLEKRIYLYSVLQ